MPANMFSPLLKGEVSHTRRVFHSGKNYFQTVHVNPFGNHDSISVNNLANAGGQAMNVASVVAGSAAIGWAGGAVATGAFAAAVSGPQAAVVLGVIGVAMALKSAYSNRESSHKALSQYVYNMVDDVAPLPFTAATLKEAAQAANYLLSEGQNQFELVSSKYQAAKRGLDTYLTSLDAEIDAFDRQVIQRNQTTNQGSRGVMQQVLTRRQQEAKARWEAAQRPGGAIFEFVRRCSHTGNYLQAPHIMHLAILEQLRPNSVVNSADSHAKHFHEAPLVASSRQMFQILEAKFTDNQRAGKIFA